MLQNQDVDVQDEPMLRVYRTSTPEELCVPLNWRRCSHAFSLFPFGEEFLFLET